MGEEVTHRTAKALGWHITKGNIEKPNEKSNAVDGRVYLDLSRIVSPQLEKQPKISN